jgi:hypothetical protein
MRDSSSDILGTSLLSLDGSALYHAIDQLHYGFEDVPDFAKVALKSIQDDYTRSISIDDSMSAIFRASHSELQNCVDDIKKAFYVLCQISLTFCLSDREAEAREYAPAKPVRCNPSTRIFLSNSSQGISSG